ncbi:MAG: hypothetical protein HY391_05265, partial [Deltaproteobacteria bacterium]|nr:hypothetical protein [Deltaproteobacteria bacterium]
LKREKARDGVAPSSRHAGPSQADKRGWDGESGQFGTAGRSAGNITIEAEQFSGGLFVARGGNGGNGGDGGDGGNGASGFVHSGHGVPPDDYSVEKAQAVCAPGSGGNAGAGASGGSAGDGGNVRIRVKSNVSRQGETFVTLLSAGKPGEGGRPGLPGRAGEPGLLVFSGPHQPLGMIFDENDPQMYRASRGAEAKKGNRGGEGKAGEVLE